MGRKNKTEDALSNNAIVPNQLQCCFEGEDLVEFLKSIRREMELARAQDAALPDKFLIKQQFAVGVNEVTRCLERMPPIKHRSEDDNKTPCIHLQAILLASDCNPRWLTKHLPALAASRDVPIIFIKDMKEGSLRLGELIKLKTAIAIGIKCKGNLMNQLVKEILVSKKICSTKMASCSEETTLSFMNLALEQAKLALEALEVPVGCVLVEEQQVIASGRNRTNETRNATRHAEMEAIDVLLEKWQKNGLTREDVALKFSRITLYVTCEPCIMCAAALSIIGIKEVYFGCGNDKFGGCGSILSLHTSAGISEKGFKCTGGVMAEEAIDMLRNFYEQGNPNAPKPHRTVVPRV